jgi:LacI family transcriptional regulator
MAGETILIPDRERPTLKTVAAETGLAVATVSRALKDAPDIGVETKRRVREAAERLGYRPNRAGVRLRTGKTNVIALVLATDTDVMNHTSRLIYAIGAALRGTAYHLVIMPYFPDEDPMTPVRYLVETGAADGVILNQTTPDDPRIRYMAARGFPFATHGRTEMGIEHPYFDFDNSTYARLTVAALAERGRRHILLIQPPAAQCYSRHMVAGALAEARRRNLRLELAEGYDSDSGAVRIEAAVRDRLSAGARPDGIVSGSTTGAMAAVAAAGAPGLTLGVEIDIASKEAIPMLHRFRRALLVVPEDVGRAGDFLARALMDTIDRRTGGALQGLEVPDRVG